jgi:ferredoxin
VSGQWRVGVDGERCIGSAVCAATAPGYFRVVDGVSAPTAPAVPAGTDDVVAAAESCPMEAIAVRDADGTLVAPTP